MDVSFLEALKLDPAGGVHPLADHGRRLAGLATGKFLIAEGRHFHLDVDAVEQRAGNFRTVTLDLQRRAVALLLLIGKKAARAGVHRGDEHEARRIIDRPDGARHGNIGVFKGLAHDFEDVALELRQLVEKEHPIAEAIDRPDFVLKASVRKLN